ncbi:primary-amine oxidase [Sarotherodon galilaeus]
MRKEWPERRLGGIPEDESTWRKCERNHDLVGAWPDSVMNSGSEASFERENEAVYGDWVDVVQARVKIRMGFRR